MGSERNNAESAIHTETQLLLYRDALALVFRHFSIKEVLLAREVCRGWREVASDSLVVKNVIFNHLSTSLARINSMSDENDIGISFGYFEMLYKNIWHSHFCPSSQEHTKDLVLYKLSLEHGLNIVQSLGIRQDDLNDMMLSLAFENANAAGAQNALAKGANIHIFDDLHFQSMLPYEEQKPFIKILLVLRALGANITFVDKQYILDEAIKAGDGGIASEMVNLGAEVRIFDELEQSLPQYGGGYSGLEVFSPTPDDPLNLAGDSTFQAIQEVEVIG